MYAEVPELALARAVICLRNVRKIVNSDEHRLSKADFVSCGGRVGKKREREDYSLYRQLVYAERSMRKIIKGELPMFDQDSKTPGKKQIFNILGGCQDLLKDTNTSTEAWDASDDEDVDKFDAGSDDEEEDEEEEEKEDEEDENEGEEEEADREEEPDDDENDPDAEEDDAEEDGDYDADEDGESDAAEDADSDAEEGEDDEEEEEDE